MKPWLEECETWLTSQYQNLSSLNAEAGSVRLRWLPADSLTMEIEKETAHSLAIEDADIGWLLFLLPYEPERLEQQVNQALGLCSRLLREANYSGREVALEQEDQDSTWRVGVVWLVEDNLWSSWQRHILDLRRESGAAEEISVDAIRINENDVRSSLNAHGLPRLLIHTRTMVSQSATESEQWLSADAQVSAQLRNFSQNFDNPRAHAFARELEAKAKSIEPATYQKRAREARQFLRLYVKNFRNLDNLEIVADRAEAAIAQAIILFGPNGTGKSSFAEALSLAAFGTSPRLEQYLDDKDLVRATTQTYLNEYISPLNQPNSSAEMPRFVWGDGEETPFVLDTDGVRKRDFEGVVLNQEDSIIFSEMPREKLAAQVLKGYSTFADTLTTWLESEEKRANEVKLAFTRKYGLSGAIKRSTTAYDRLAQSLLSVQLQRPSSEFLDWLRFLGGLGDEWGQTASKLASEWSAQQSNVVNRLATTLAQLKEVGATQQQVAQAIREKLDEFDGLANRSGDLRQRLVSRLSTLREQVDTALTQIESWGAWLAIQANASVTPEPESKILKAEIENLAKERAELERTGKELRGRLDLLDQARQFLVDHWSGQHPDTCPVCDSNVEQRNGIEVVVSTLQEETNATIQKLRERYIQIQKSQQELDAKLKAAGLATCPLASEDQARLMEWLHPFLRGLPLEHLLCDAQLREQLKGDLLRMRLFPEAPKPYADALLEAERLAEEFINLTHEADRALEDPQSIAEVKKAFEQRLEIVLKDHLPSTLGKVWQEITMTLTTASWLLPDQPNLKLEQRGKALSVQTSESGRYVRYIYNAAERHVLGLAWFFTYYLAKRRFDEAWMLLDDPAQEMDQPSFRELVRFWETLLRIHKRKKRPLTMIVALHQEERALDATRATNGQLYILGWQRKQQESAIQTSIKRVVLLGPGFHPLKPEKMFSQ